MSTSTTPTPKTDAFREQFKHCGSFTEYRREAERFCVELELSRDQWKAVAERLAGTLLIEQDYYLSINNGRTHWEGCEKEHRLCASLSRFNQALTEFNQLKSTTEKK